MKLTIFLFLIALLCLCTTNVSAFWGSDSTDSVSGLNVAGFDVNTITTIHGSVTTLPASKGEEQHTVMTVATAKGDVTVVLGPWWYWEKQAINLAKNQDVTITGSLAQGKDGLLYIFAQRIDNRSTDETVTIRSETGKPLWAHNGSGSQSGSRLQSGSGSRAGSGNRGSGTRGGRR